MCLPTEGDALQLKPGHNLGVDLPIIKEQLDENKALLRGVSTNTHVSFPCWIILLLPLLVMSQLAAGKSFNSLSRRCSSPW